MMQIIEKGWGREKVFARTEDYCGKYLVFDYEGNKFSMHFHNSKDETWTVLQGSFKLLILNTVDASIQEYVLSKNDVWRNEPLVPHQLIALEDNSIIIEVSTYDNPYDNYRVFAGDSQK